MKFFMISFVFLLTLLMPIIAVYSENASEAEVESASDYIGVSLEIPQETQELIGLKTAQVESSETVEKISVNGRIAQDVEQVVEVFAPEAGIVKKCSTPIGSIVSKGEVVCVIESENSKSLIEIKAPSSGVMIADYEKVRDKVDTISPIHTIADLSKLSANFDVYENDIGKVKIDQRVLVYSTAYPDQPFEGKIVFISPRVDESSFTIKIRVLIDNPDYLLKPGMFVRGEILLEGQQANFSDPSEAVQDLEGTSVIFVKDEEESFVPTEVKIKYAGRRKSSLEGEINVGDLVVADGAFILKSKIMEDEIAGGCTDGH